MQNTEEIWRLVDAHQDDFIALSDRVWETPELCYAEFRSCAEHTAMLEAKGFRVTREVAGIPTAVMGEAGEDGPVIAILGEYDALPGLSQEAGVRRTEATARTGLRPWLRPQPAGLRVHAGRHGGEGLSGCERHTRAASATMAARPRKAAQRKASWPGLACSATSISRSPGIRHRSRACIEPHSLANTRIDFSFMAAPRTPRRHRISGAARWTRWN